MTFLTAASLSRRFGATKAVDDISFELERGHLLAIFGPNGAGKSSLLKLLAGTLLPDSGRIVLDGEPLLGGDREWYGRVGILSHKTSLYGSLTAEENLRFYAKLFGLKNIGDLVRERLDAVGLSDRSRSVVREFSRGMRQRLALARTLLHDPALVLLDEPYTGLDPQAAALLNGVLATLRSEERTVVLVTHNIVEGTELADVVAVQARGRFRYFDSVAAIPPTGIVPLYHELLEESA